jgi:hypothetical protein
MSAPEPSAPEPEPVPLRTVFHDDCHLIHLIIMIESFRSLFAPPRHFILIVTALWIGLALAERRTQRHGISKEQLNNMTFYSLIGYMLGGRILFAVNNLSSFMGSP